MAKKQHRLTAAETITTNVHRIKHVTLHPDDQVLVMVQAGDDQGDGVFKPTGGKAYTFAVADLPAPLRAALDLVESQTLSYLAAQGLIPAGAEEDGSEVPEE